MVAWRPRKRTYSRGNTAKKQQTQLWNKKEGVPKGQKHPGDGRLTRNYLAKQSVAATKAALKPGLASGHGGDGPAGPCLTERTETWYAGALAIGTPSNAPGEGPKNEF